MYINFDYALKKSITFPEIIALQLLHQNTSGKMEEYLLQVEKNVLNKLYKEDLLEFVKAKNKEHTFQSRARLSKKGKNLYRNLTSYTIDENDELIYNFVYSVFKELDKAIPSKNKMIKLIASFRLESGLNHKQLYELCKRFVNDEENMKFNNSLEYMFFKPTNSYSKFNLNESRLWAYFEKIKK